MPKYAVIIPIYKAEKTIRRYVDINKPNGGVSTARNAGLDIAKCGLRCLLTAYFGRRATDEEYRLFHANKLYLDYLWTLWGKARVPFDGEVMEEYAAERYLRLKKNLAFFIHGK